MSRRIVVNVVNGLSRLLTKVFWRKYGYIMLGRSFPWIFAFVFAATFAPQAMERAHPEWMRLVLAVMLVWFIILTIAMAIFVLYEIGTDDDLQ